MKITSTWVVLLMAGVYGLGVGAHVDHNESDLDVDLQSNHHDWKNPEDLPSMPQCIAQQDQSAWLRAMTSCTRERCTSHFIFCTHKQWLTQLSCLSTAFSPEVIQQYFPYCGRSILAKAQLYDWINIMTGRTWLIEVGDTIELQDLSPASLSKGYADVDVIHKAPTCLIDSASALSNEHFQRVMASCSFTDTAKHTGNVERPWEYSGRQHSLIALDYETVGYDLALNYHNYLWNRLSDGEYFDRACFCDAYTLNFDREPCSGSGDLDLTKERLWIYATCGSASLPPNWADNLKTTLHAFIPVEDWHWPSCVADMPNQVIELRGQCATDACEIDSGGFCRVRRTVDRACFCRSISYDSCGGSCHILENRIGYINWLHDLCGSVQGWDGLPENWRELAVPTPAEMIPWRWTVKPSNDSNGHSEYTRPAQTCPSNAWKLGSFALVNIATFLGVVSSRNIMGTPPPRTAAHGRTPWHEHPVGWVYKGILIAALQLLANGVNSFATVQRTPGYETVPALKLMLLWSSIPQLSWLTVMVIVLQPLQQARKFSAVASVVFAEVILQSLSLYYMLITVKYGREHEFYFRALDGAEKGGLAEIMYAGALLWLFFSGAALVRLIQARRKMDSASAGAGAGWQRAERTSRTGGYHNHGAYGTFPSRGQGRTQDQWGPRPQRTVSPVFSYTAAGMFMFLLWIAQWLFWGGFIGLSSEEFCPPKVKLLTAVWIFAAWVGVDIARL
ncbi:hypothetical protein BJY01DRAFT_246757 [Aspergillus pseudoustus]|uniref:Extracellular membrane protein CFEM domain-containing protein n=1 Tax=Aspergillus pseudoustus TaxID=1810923 RepID=A0ABR4K5D7_9EURO